MSKSKQKGTAFETLIVNYFQRFWPHVERRALTGVKDRGDVVGLFEVIEIKNHKRMDLGEWFTEAAKEAENASEVGYVVIHKRKGVGDPAEQYVSMPLWHYVDLKMGAQ